MNCERFREHIIELIDDRLDEPAVADARVHLEGCASCRQEYFTLRETLLALDALPKPAPSPRLRSNISALIEVEKRSLRLTAASRAPRTPKRPARRFWPSLVVRILAGCGLITIGFLAGMRHARAPAAPIADPATQRELADLRQRVDSMGQLVSNSLVQQQRPTNDRLERVLASAVAPRPGEDVVGSLITSLALDPSVNVRLNALEALYTFRDQDVVRTSVLVSLPRETSPLVQVAMIDFLAATRERDAGPALQKLSANDTVDRNVREAAQRALTQL